MKFGRPKVEIDAAFDLVYGEMEGWDDNSYSCNEEIEHVAQDVL